MNSFANGFFHILPSQSMTAGRKEIGNKEVRELRTGQNKITKLQLLLDLSIWVDPSDSVRVNPTHHSVHGSK